MFFTFFGLHKWYKIAQRITKIVCIVAAEIAAELARLKAQEEERSEFAGLDTPLNADNTSRGDSEEESSEEEEEHVVCAG